jgi:NADPH-dependent curcumin reductase CurA
MSILVQLAKFAEIKIIGMVTNCEKVENMVTKIIEQAYSNY